MNYKCSIIVPVFNQYVYTKNCLKNLLSLDPKIHQIIVVNDGSTDETDEELLKIENENFVHYFNEKNQGFSASCNKGFENANGEIIIFLNNDIKVKETNWTDIVIETVEKNIDTIVSANGGFVDPMNDFKFCYETKANDKRPINYLSGWCLAATKKTFNKLKENKYKGPFSEEFGKAYFEDTNIGFLATKLGIAMKVIDVPLIHLGRKSSAQLDTAKLYNEARQIFIKKWKKEA